MITSQKYDTMITRNSSYFKRFPGESNFGSGSDGETDGEGGEVTGGDNPEDIVDQHQVAVPRAYPPRQRS